MKPLAALHILIAVLTIPPAFSLTTDERIRRDGYPVEQHVVQSLDGYTLTMFRIPHPIDWKEDTPRSVVFIQHGLLSSSDTFILNGRGIALPYMLVDAGYDVWLGNNRGNKYSLKHVQHSVFSPSFWQFEWHEIAIYDLPVMIDYVLRLTKQRSMHYIAHSQGVTILFVLASLRPEYNAKIKSAHILAPVVFMEHTGGPILRALTPLLGQSNAMMKLIGSNEFLPTDRLTSKILMNLCLRDTPAMMSCARFVFGLFGRDWAGLNKTLFPDILSTHPAGSSTSQVMHYLQGRISGKFQQFDHGLIGNKLVYGQFEPPEYNLSKVTLPVYVYYGQNDFLAGPKDVAKLIRALPNVKYAFKIPSPRFNHIDYMWSMNVKEIVYDKILMNVNQAEESER